jgi:hypothetical protein
VVTSQWLGCNWYAGLRWEALANAGMSPFYSLRLCLRLRLCLLCGAGGYPSNVLQLT